MSLAPVARSAPPAPAGLTLTPDGDGARITRRWLRPKHVPMTAVTLGLLWLLIDRGEGGMLVVGGLFLGSWLIQLLPMFINTTTIDIRPDQVLVQHGPLPSLLSRPQALRREEIARLYARPFGSAFEIAAERSSGEYVSLVRPLVTVEQARFVEQQLASRLGALLQAPSDVPDLEKSGGGGVALVVVPVVLGALALVAFMGSSSVEGSLSGSMLGTAGFVPDDCASGEPRGYFGVELTDSQTPGTVVRLVRDPVAGSKLAVEKGGQITALSATDCSALDLGIHQTNSSYNDVWIIEGSARIACPGLTGEVTFSGCH